ncbi:response regulator [Bacillus tuaregi]|uniref:response regulator n=1 Tax=Bacillus tuaregi TaxID=1816695 RepID=UPI0008F80ED3|nr:response regulator [Bacillus tuaregi]
MARILIVDDAKFMRMTLSTILTKAGHEIVGEGENGREAVRLYRELQPDLVTLDITMPEVSGIQAIKEIKNEFPNSKVIMCSAMGQQKMVVEAIESGAKDFIVKPFDASRVVDAIDRVLK